MTKVARLLAAAALILGGCLAAAAQTQNAPGAGQTPPQEPPPVADAGTSGQTKCISENDTFERRGKQPVFTIALENKCEQRMRCKVFVYITGSRGATRGRHSIALAPKSKGAAAKGSYTIKTKEYGGAAQSSRQCRVY